MVYIYFLFLLNISFVLSITYSCDRNAACGCSKIDATLNKIVGGEAAVDSSWGWAVSLRKGTNGHFCGGLIISPLHIITAAHCVVNSIDIIRNARVIVGINVLADATSSIAQVRSVINVFSHPQYSSVSKANDIAVLRLNQALNISNGVGTARLCLPYVMTTNTTNNYPVPGSSLVAIGWGTIISSEQFIPSSRHLQQVTVNGMSASHSMCKGTINDRQLQFCAGVIGGGKDTCQGDSGGPIMHFEPTQRQWVLAGITSYGTGCGLPGYAGVYTRISMYHSWLGSIVTDRFLQVSVNVTSSDLTDSARSILSSYWLIVLSLYAFAQR